jgi:hypothetical protein
VYGTPNNWSEETVVVNASGSSGTITGVTLDGSNKVHAIFDRGSVPSMTISYATNSSGSWVTTDVETGVDDTHAGLGDVILDGSGYAHLFYAIELTVGNYYLRHATNASGSWQVETIDSQSTAAYNNYQADIKSDGDFVVVFSYIGMNTIKVAVGTWGSWAITDCGATDDGWPQLDLAIDSNDKVHIVYGERVNSSGRLFYLTDVSGSWVEKKILSGNSYYRYVSIIIVSDKLHVMCGSVSVSPITVRLHYGTNSSGSWNFFEVRSGTSSIWPIPYSAIAKRGSKIGMFYHFQYSTSPLTRYLDLSEVSI